MCDIEMLDLTSHGPDEIPGKQITINAVNYEVLEMIGEGGEAFVFPIRNLRSQLSRFVAKIYRWRPGHPNFARVQQLVTEKAFAQSARMFEIDQQLATKQEKPFAFHDTPETYEIHGGLIQLQERIVTGQLSIHEGHIKYCQSVDEPELHPEMLLTAIIRMREGRFDEARQDFNELLARNPNHTDAMFYLADCLLALGATDEAESILETAISIEPNDAQLYHRLAKVLLIAKTPHDAVQAIERTLRRWPWDVCSWYLQAALALDFDVAEAAQHRISEGIRLAPECRLFQELGGQLASGCSRAEDRRQLRQEAAQLAAQLVSADEANGFDVFCNCIRLTAGGAQWRSWLNHVEYKTSAMYVGDYPDRLPPFVTLGAYPDAVAFRHAVGLAYLSAGQHEQSNRQQVWAELLQALYALYEAASVGPESFVIPPLTSGEEGEKTIVHIAPQTFRHLRQRCSRPPPRNVKPPAKKASQHRSSVPGEDRARVSHRSRLWVGLVVVTIAALSVFSLCLTVRRKQPSKAVHEAWPTKQEHRNSINEDVAEDFLMELVSLPDPQQRLLREARRSLRLGRNETALEAANEVVKSHPRCFLAAYYRGIAAQRCGDNPQAIADLSTIIDHIDIKRYVYGAYFHRGVAYLEMNRNDKAIADLSEALAREPSAAESYWHRHKAHLASGNPSQASSDRRKAFELDTKWRKTTSD